MDRARLKVPVRTLLDDTLEEQNVHRLWRAIECSRGSAFGGHAAIERSRAGKRSVARENSRVRSPRAVSLGFAFAAACTLAVWLVLRSHAGPLRSADGSELGTALAATVPRSLALDDGSRVELFSATRLDMLENSGRAVTMALRTGGVVFDIRPGGPRTWRVECGSVTVEVVGTRFTCERTGSTSRVEVERGAVVVRGDSVPDRVMRLGAGESLSVPPPEAHVSDGVAKAKGPPASAPSNEADRAPVPSVSAIPSARVNTSPPAATAIGSSSASAGTPSGPSPAEALFVEADATRRAGRLDDSIRLLHRLLAEHPRDPRAPLAEFTLGRLYLDSRGDAAKAALHFQRAVDRGLPGALGEDARARLVEAHTRAGNTQAAQAAAARYRSMYPQGRRSAEVDRWVGSAP